ncbi:MAG TPA: glycosyltransferase family 4 protein [Thermoleophilaceae bacterium]|nr:glycosyltransferase family 4 protein [Thermoleophilaceae bacterium]
MAAVDIAIVSLGTTMGWRRGDEALATQIEAAGATCELRPMRLGLARHLQRSMATTDVLQALAARRAASGVDARAVVYSSITAALLQPLRRPHAVRFDTIAALSRPGVGGAWQRRRERAVLGRADLLLPWSEAAAEAALRAVAAGPAPSPPDVVVLPCVVDLPGGVAADAPDATAYAANPEKRGLDVLCEAWRAAAPEGARLVVGGIGHEDALRWLARRGVAEPTDVEFVGAVPRERWTALVAGSRVYLSAARYEDWGVAQMEALAAGTPLVTVPTPGPNAALPIARRIGSELIASDASAPALAAALRTGLAMTDEQRARYGVAVRRALEPYSDAALRKIVAERVLPALLGSR